MCELAPPPSSCPQVNLSVPTSKLRARLCVLLCAKQPEDYQLFVEGATLTSIKEGQRSEVRNALVGVAT